MRPQGPEAGSSWPRLRLTEAIQNVGLVSEALRPSAKFCVHHIRVASASWAGCNDDHAIVVATYIRCARPMDAIGTTPLT
jgi:hypothetical protein